MDSIAAMADDAAALATHVGWRRYHVFGASMGGMAAQELVLRHPDAVDRLVLGVTNPGGAHAGLVGAHEIRGLDTAAMLRSRVSSPAPGTSSSPPGTATGSATATPGTSSSTSSAPERCPPATTQRPAGCGPGWCTLGIQDPPPGTTVFGHTHADPAAAQTLAADGHPTTKRCFDS